MPRHAVSLLLATTLWAGCKDPDGPTSADPDAAALRLRLHDAGLEPLPAAPTVTDPMFLLGRALAFDPVLSGNEDIACLTCHHPALGTDDDRPLSSGVGATGLGADRTAEPVIPRSAPSLFNLHVYDTLFWDSRVEAGSGTHFVTPAGAALTPELQDALSYGLVAAQALFPVTSRDEMRGLAGENEVADLDDDAFVDIWDGLMARLAAIPAYVDLFEAAYPEARFDDLHFGHAANAIAAFEMRAFSTPNTPLDRFLDGDDTALTEAQRSGAHAFLDAGCAECHTGPGLSDFGTHNTCLPHVGPGKGHGKDGDQDYGRGGVVPEGGPFAFRTAPLRNVTLTGPWGHAGQFGTLRSYVEHYADPEGALAGYDPEVELADEVFWPLHDPKQDAEIMAAMDPMITAMDIDVDAVLVFLTALEDPDSTDLSWTIPSTVPSGLPVP